MKLWQIATAELWAITTPALQTVLDIASRTIGSEKESIDAIAARVGHDLDNSHHTTIREGVAIIPVVGPLFRYANLFTRVSGATSYELLAQDITSALESDEINALILSIDSPGGEVNGCAELSQLIFESRGIKPIMAYVSGDAASGAYWIASACDEIIASPTSGLGSIGVVGIFRGEEETENTIEIVSSQSPHKRLDIHNDDDRSKIQSRIDALASVFVDSIARYRDVDTKTVLEQYGGGDVFIGEQAVTRGLADRIGTFEKTLAELSTKDPATERGFLLEPSTGRDSVTPLSTTQEFSMATSETEKIMTTEQNDTVTANKPLTLADLKANYPDLAIAIKAEGYEHGIRDGVMKGADEERERIGAILNSDRATGRESLARHFAFATALPVSDVLAALEASPVAETAAPKNQSSHGFEHVMAAIDNPAIEPAAGDEPQSEAEQATAIAQRIAAYHKTTRGV